MNEVLAQYAEVAQRIAPLVPVFRRRPAAEIEELLRGLRRTVTSSLRALPAGALEAAWWAGPGTCARKIEETGLPLLPARPEDAAVVEVLREDLRAGWSSPHAPAALLAARMYGGAHRWPLPAEGAQALPPWLLRELVSFAFPTVPPFFRDAGDNLALLDHAKRWTVGLAGLLGELEHDPALQQELLARAVASSNVGCYFNEENLRPLVAARAALAGALLHARGAALGADFAPRPAARERLRVGLLLPHLEPSTEAYFGLAHLEHLDRARFEPVVIALRAPARPDHPLGRVFAAAADRVVILPGLADDVGTHAAAVRSLDLDVALLAGNVTYGGSPFCYLAHHRLARLQVALGGSPVTTGLPSVDAFLIGRDNEGPGADGHYVERLELFDGWGNVFAYDHDREPATVDVSRRSLGLPDDAVVFVSGANLFKILPETDRAWARLLAEVPGSRLLLFPFNPNWSDDYAVEPFRRRITAALAAAGVDPARLILHGPMPARADVQRLIGLGDVYLDSHPFSGSCSIFDALVVGCPPVARTGGMARSRHAGLMLAAAGVPELVTDSEEAYVALALRLAREPAWRAELREKIATGMRARPFTDTRAFGEKIGAALAGLWTSTDTTATTFTSTTTTTSTSTSGAAGLDVREVQRVADAAAGAKGFAALTDRHLIQRLIAPYFRALAPLGGPPMHLVDVGACHGEVAAPFLDDGWTADLLEPDPAAAAVCAQRLSAHAARLRLHPVAASDRAAGELPFHQNAVAGLSGLTASPFGADARVVPVRAVRVGELLAAEGRARVDFLKIDTEGHDFAALEGHDFERLPPRLVLVEYGLDFAGQTTAAIAGACARMAARGYDAVNFECDDDGNFARGRWVYRLVAVHVDRPLGGPGSPAPAANPHACGNILFYRRGDQQLLRGLAALMSSLAPRAARPTHSDGGGRHAGEVSPTG